MENEVLPPAGTIILTPYLYLHSFLSEERGKVTGYGILSSVEMVWLCGWIVEVKEREKLHRIFPPNSFPSLIPSLTKHHLYDAYEKIILRYPA